MNLVEVRLEIKCEIRNKMTWLHKLSLGRVFALTALIVIESRLQIFKEVLV